MAHRVCTNCGAPMTGPTKVCEFCGAEQAPDPPPPPPPRQVVVQKWAPPPAYVPQQQPQAAGRAVALAVGSVAVLGAVATAIAVGTASSHTTPAMPNISIPNVGDPLATPTKKLVPISALHTTSLDWTNDVAIERTGMVGTIEKFDPLANWDWALSVGRGWWSDAEMYTLDIDPIDKDGTINATANGARAEFHLVSKACEKDQKKRAETEKSAKDNSCSLEINIGKNGPTVRLDLISVGRDDRSHAIQKPPCSIAQVFDQLEKTGKLTKRPAYRVRLEHDVFGLNYTVSNGSGAASMDGVDLSPNFCGAKPVVTTTAKPTTTAAPSIAQQQEAPPFDRTATAAALKKVDISSCKPLPATTKVTITFAPDGSASNVKCDNPCLASVYKSVRVPAFSGSPVSVSVTAVQ